MQDFEPWINLHCCPIIVLPAASPLTLSFHGKLFHLSSQTSETSNSILTLRDLAPNSLRKYRFPQPRATAPEHRLDPRPQDLRPIPRLSVKTPFLFPSLSRRHCFQLLFFLFSPNRCTDSCPTSPSLNLHVHACVWLFPPFKIFFFTFIPGNLSSNCAHYKVPPSLVLARVLSHPQSAKPWGAPKLRPQTLGLLSSLSVSMSSYPKALNAIDMLMLPKSYFQTNHLRRIWGNLFYFFSK